MSRDDTMKSILGAHDITPTRVCKRMNKVVPMEGLYIGKRVPVNSPRGGVVGYMVWDGERWEME